MRNRTLRSAMRSLVIGAAVIGCTQDLNISSPNAPDSETFWATQADAIAGINATYNGLQQRGTYARWLGFAYDIRSDEGLSTSGWTELKDWTGFLQGNYNFEPPREIWWHTYWTISRANQVIAHVPSINMDAALRDRIVGEAKFIRGLMYFNLVTLFGNVPLITVPPALTDRPGNATPAEIYAQIEKDLTEAAAVLPLPGAYSGADIGRATKGAALAMLGKAQLQQRKWTPAAATLAQVTAMPYNLIPNYADNFTDSFENNVESVFEVQFGGPSQVSQGVVGQNYARMIGACRGAAGVDPSYCDGQPTRWYFNQFFPDTTNRLVFDPRIDATLFWNKPGGEDVYGTQFSARYGAGSNAVWWKKWGQYYVIQDQNWDNPINYRVIRFADVLLMQAEALNEANAGNVAAAAALVQRVRTRAGAGPVPPGMTQAQMRDYILHERLVELGLEQTRWLDMQRHDLLTPARAPDDPQFTNFQSFKVLMPIPQNEIDLNPNLKQNPGY
jgi:starch-binding outer membrane protein, SusD/RagB family